MNNLKKKVEFDASIQTSVVYFLNLIKGSYSLNLAENRRVLDAMPTLSQQKVDMLINVFHDEVTKFNELREEHPADVKILEREAFNIWRRLSGEYKLINNLLLL